MKQLLQFVKKETVLTVAWILAFVSMFWEHPSMKYVDYIDFKSLGILWSLMVVMAGLKSKGLFEKAGSWLLGRTKKAWQLAAVLVFLCFFASMFITNDVSLITFVPFAVYTLEESGREDLLIPVIALQTLAANLGSMLTPIGNPQNLYLYGLSGISMGGFIGLMLPYSCLSFLLLVLSLFFLRGKNKAVSCRPASRALTDRKTIAAYGALFLLALLVVSRILPYLVLVLAVLVLVFLMDRQTLVHVDYALLFTFVGFFIFTGNLRGIPAFARLLEQMVEGHEVYVGILASQVISNVPAALLLSSFTDHLQALIVGVNLGGLGTLIASMASLISYKTLAHSHNELKGRYLIVFTAMNLVFLLVLVAAQSVL